tara:strand:+ start:393 stop:560 length:168 start_codon:yes stop_codon:yes gene_type:complete
VDNILRHAGHTGDAAAEHLGLDKKNDQGAKYQPRPLEQYVKIYPRLCVGRQDVLR